MSARILSAVWNDEFSCIWFYGGIISDFLKQKTKEKRIDMSVSFHRSLVKADGDFPRRGLTFAAATACLICTFVASSIAIPMMAVWRSDLALTESETAMTVVSYFAGCVLTLFFFARLSNFFGRKPIVLAALMLGMASSLIYANANGVSELNIGRFLQGFSCGFASSAAMSWVVDSAPLNRPWLGTALTAAGPNIGLSLGTLITGFVLQSEVLSPSALFDCAAVLLTLCACAAVISTETMRFGTESLGSVFIPKVALPVRLRGRFVASAVAFIGTWGVGSFLQGFSAYLCSVVFGEVNALLAGVLYLVLIVPNALLGVISGRFEARLTLKWSIVLFSTAALAAFSTLLYPSVWVLLVSVALTGMGGGAACSSGLRFLLAGTTINERAGVISALYLSAYVGSVMPNLVIACTPGKITESMMMSGFYVWILATLIGVMVALRRVKVEKT